MRFRQSDFPVEIDERRIRSRFPWERWLPRIDTDRYSKSGLDRAYRSPRDWLADELESAARDAVDERDITPADGRDSQRVIDDIDTLIRIGARFAKLTDERFVELLPLAESFEPDEEINSPAYRERVERRVERDTKLAQVRQVVAGMREFLKAARPTGPIGIARDGPRDPITRYFVLRLQTVFHDYFVDDVRAGFGSIFTAFASDAWTAVGFPNDPGISIPEHIAECAKRLKRAGEDFR